MSDAHTVTELLRAADAGDAAAFQRLYARTYEELRGLAHKVRESGSCDTLNTTALVHEAYLKLAPGESLAATDRVHFFRIAARAMRQVLVDAARRRRTREAGALALEVESGFGGLGRVATRALDLDRALRELETLSPRQAEVVECRFFAGLSVEETALALGVSPPTVKRDWRVARAWLVEALEPSTSAPPGP